MRARGEPSHLLVPSKGPPSMRTRNWLISLLSLLVGGCVPANPPPQQYGYQQPQPYANPTQPPPPQPEPPPQPQPNPYPAEPPPAQPPTEPAYVPPPGPIYVDLNVNLEGNDVP